MADMHQVDAWLEWLEHNKGRSPQTCDKYRGYLARLATFLAERSFGRASAADLERFAGLHAHQEGLSPRSRRALVAAVRGFYSWLHQQQLIAADPASGLPYPQAGNRLPVAMELKHAEAIIMAPDITTFIGIRDAAILAVLIGCGVRLSGLIALNQSDLFFVNDDGRERLAVRVTEKGGKQRFVPAPDETRLLLHAYLGHEDLDRIDRVLPNGDQVLFVSVRNRTVPEHDYHGENRRISVRSVQDMIEKYAGVAGVPRAQAHAHAFRHLYGTELAEEDVDLLQRQALLGHADPKTTQIYTQLAMRKLAKTVEKANPFRKIRSPVTDLARHINSQRRP